MTVQILKQHETPVCVYTNYTDGTQPEGIEYYVCRFKDLEHPVNKKAALFKMSGAEQCE